MVNDVDVDGSGLIEFDEFLLIIKNSDASEKTAKINKFFKDMSNNVLGTKTSALISSYRVFEDNT